MELSDGSFSSHESISICDEKDNKIKTPRENKSFKANVLGFIGLGRKVTDEDVFEPEPRRRFLFDDRALQKGGQLNELFVSEEPPEQDIKDVVDADDRRIEHYVSEDLVGSVVDGGYFRAFIFFLIVVNSILIALQTDEVMSVRYRYMFSIFDQIVLATFVCELLLKWYYGFWIFWKVGWNILDFTIIAALILGPQLSFLSSSRILRILRVLRAFRSLRSISALAGLSLVVQTILQSIPDMANIVLLLVIVLLVFGVSGVTLFGKNVPDRFGNLESALFSLFICVTQDGWVDIYNTFKAQGGWVHAGGMLYFFCSIMVGAFVFANLVVAVVVTNLEMAMKIHRAENAGTANVILTPADEHDPDEKTNIILNKTFSDNKYYKGQNPLQLADLTNLTIESISQYYMLLIALEENLAEYQNIRKDLESVYTAVAVLNVVDEDSEVHLARGSSISIGGAKKVAGIDLRDVRKGDILSNLIKLEESKILNSRDKQTMNDLLSSLHGEHHHHYGQRRPSMRHHHRRLSAGEHERNK